MFFLVVVFVANTKAEIPLSERRSGYEFMSRETRAMQDDEKTGPAVLSLLEGEELWRRNCASCHGIGKMKGVASRYPAFDSSLKRLLNLDQRINLCRTEQQMAPAFTYEGREILALSAFIGRQSKGMPIAIEMDRQNKPFIEAGRTAFHQRRGQLNLACTQCHDDN
ncbi:MAG: c-type cytochrome, partial [Betaproteobacteria bacterium]